jgi:hypothetical protein
MPKFVRFVLLLSVFTLFGVGTLPNATAATSHKDKSMVDIDTPLYIGYDSTLKAYHFRVKGRWIPACSGKFCWPAYSGSTYDIGTNDAVRIRFSDAVQFKKFRIRHWDYCGAKRYDKTTTASTGSFEDAYAGVDDKVVLGWKETTWNGKVTTEGNCKSSTMPTSWFASGSSGGYGSVAYWADMKTRSFTYDVWVNPAPSQGSCYDRLYVKGGYTHTWGTQALSWSAGLSYPWGVGVGLGVLSGDADFTVFQGNDGFADPDLTTPKLCRH